MYVFPPLIYPRDISQAINLKYKEGVVPDDYYLFLFVNNNKITKQYKTYNLKVGFNDNKYTGIYEVNYPNAKYEIRFLGKENYWLYKMEKDSVQ